MKTNPSSTRRWLSPLLLATCGWLYAVPAPAHDDDPGRRPSFFARLFHGSHKHKAPPSVAVEPQVVERITTVTYPDGRVERYVNTPAPAGDVVREEVPSTPVPSYSMRSVRERPATDVRVEPAEPGLRLPEGYRATHAPRVSPRPQMEDPIATDERPVSHTITQVPPRRPQEQAKPRSFAQADTEGSVNREPENSRPQPRPAPAEKKVKQEPKAPQSKAAASRELTSAAPENFLEEAPPSKAIGTVQKKFDHAPPSVTKTTSSENATPPEKMLIGGKLAAPADLPSAKSAKEPPKTNSPAAEGKNYPLASRAEKPGFLKSPFEPFNELDATGLASGTLARDPTTGKVFRVP